LKSRKTNFLTIVAFLIGMFVQQDGHAQSLNATVINFNRADSVAALYPDHAIINLRDLSQKLTSPLKTEPEKFRALFKWVCDNISNDYYLFTTNKKKRETLSGDALRDWNKAFNITIIEKLIKEHKTVCTGYAYLIRELARSAGLSCEIVNGYGRNVVANIGGTGVLNHSWNAVRLDNKWYLCDATWASGAIDSQQKAFVHNYNDLYFLTDPVQFIRNHYPQEAKWTLINDHPSLHEFLNAPLAYPAAMREHFFADDDQFEVTLQKGARLKLSFEGPPGLTKNLSMAVGDNRVQAQPQLLPVADNRCRYQLSQAFHFRGTYAVHVLLKDEYLYSYRVVVR
jgi:hypothetical protein